MKTYLSPYLKGKRKLHQSINRMVCPLKEHTHNDFMSSIHDTDSVNTHMKTELTFALFTAAVKWVFFLALILHGD